MIAKLKIETARKKNDQKNARIKLERLSILAEEFLEKSFTRESLAINRKEMERLKGILFDNLWLGNINPDDLDWCAETDDEFAQMILWFHELLVKGFWNSFKKELLFIKSIRGSVVAPPGYEGLESEPMINIDGFIEIKIPKEKMTVRIIRNSDNVIFMRDSVDAIPALLDLLQGLPLDNLKFCGSADCQKFIVKTTGKDKKFCCGICQSRQYQRKFRETFPEGHKKYHREYYQQIKERKERREQKT